MEGKHIVISIVILAIIGGAVYLLFFHENKPDADAPTIADVQKEAERAVTDAMADAAEEKAVAAEAAAEEAQHIADVAEDPAEQLVAQQTAQVAQNEAEQAAIEAEQAAVVADLAKAEATGDEQAAQEAVREIQDIVAEKQVVIDEQARLAAQAAALLEQQAQMEAARIAREEAARLDAERVRAAEEAARLAEEEHARRLLEEERLAAEEAVRRAAEEAERVRREQQAAQIAAEQQAAEEAARLAAEQATQAAPVVTEPIILDRVKRIEFKTAVTSIAAIRDIQANLIIQQADESVVALQGVIQRECLGPNSELLMKDRRRFNGSTTWTIHPNTTSVSMRIDLRQPINCAAIMLQYNTANDLGITQFTIRDGQDTVIVQGSASMQDMITLYDGWKVEPFIQPPYVPRYSYNIVRQVTKIVQIIRPLTASSGRIRFGGQSIDITAANGQRLDLSGIFANENVVFDVYGRQVRKWWSGSIVNSNGSADLTPTFDYIAIDFKIPATDIARYRMAVWDAEAYSVTVEMHGADGITSVTVMNPTGTFQVWPAT